MLHDRPFDFYLHSILFSSKCLYTLHKCYTAVETGSFSDLCKKKIPTFFSGIFSVVKNEQVHPQLINALSPYLKTTGIKRSLIGLSEKLCF